MESAHYNIKERKWITHSAHECAIPYTPKLRAWVLNVPPLRVQSNELGATRTEVYLCGVLKSFFQQNPEYTNTQQDLPV